MSDMGALPQFELPRSDDQNHTEPCKAKHHESNPENTQTAAHASSPQNCSRYASISRTRLSPMPSMSRSPFRVRQSSRRLLSISALSSASMVPRERHHGPHPILTSTQSSEASARRWTTSRHSSMLSNARGFGRIWPAGTGPTNITTQIIGASRLADLLHSHRARRRRL